MGRMLLPSLTQGMSPARQNGSLLGLQQTAQMPPQSQNSSAQHGVKNVSTMADFARLLEGAKSSCAVVFFTSATCPPCKTVYPLYDELGEQLQGKATLIKVDISLPGAQEIARQYDIRATPTFITFLKGEQENKWTGADPIKLRGNVQLLAQMSSPTHPHNNLKVPSFSSAGSAVLYSKTPPMAKLLAKMGDDSANKPEVQSLKTYLDSREKQGLSDTVLPNLSELSGLMRSSVTDLPLDSLFTIVDLFRCALVDPRISGYFAEEADHQTIRDILKVVNDQTDCPYALRLVTLQTGCNLFSTPLFGGEILRDNVLRGALASFISSSFLDESHNNVRVAASSLLYNLALANRQARANKHSAMLSDADQVELAASVVEAIGQEEKSAEALQGMLSALGHLFYEADLDGELADLLRALDAQGTVLSKKTAFPAEKLVGEVGSELLGKGLRRR
jgi:desumoylating isopeptidase 1